MFVIIVMYAYFIDILVKEFWKLVNNWRRYGQK